ncbi:hypothetical protein KOI35_41650 [Actinoplanes bogorensis]|uniref:Uncharacterized protein n=1 Tax=Paractinoplanes bogorensis TaxID=1610840 RepID=A0ABS5Z2W3_9ACTN|nr:hypothetical protein [Actinoplanes bogorensis]MBU2670031.1 hypothetical protein [Actinoplanes bogorensis]
MRFVGGLGFAIGTRRVDGRLGFAIGTLISVAANTASAAGAREGPGAGRAVDT